MGSSAPLPFEEPIFVTRPILPEMSRFLPMLEAIWKQRWLTNQGPLHAEFERALGGFLGVAHLSLVNNGTTGLMLACRGLELTGDVVTTPFTFPATPAALTWCGLTPRFADIDATTLTLDPEAVERALTPQTSAILAVHVYGQPCRVDALQALADRHGLRVLYDGAHAFGTRVAGRPLCEFGDASVLSFHSTKLFHTGEGGAVVAPERSLKERIELLRNFGIRDETTVALPGINGKLTELQAALGLANLELVEPERLARARIAHVYLERLRSLEGITCVEPPAGVSHSHQYFVIRVAASGAGISRDDLHERLKTFNVFTRRYFFPLCSD